MRLMSIFEGKLSLFSKGIGHSNLLGQRGGYPNSTLCSETGNEASQSRELLFHVLGRALAVALFLWPVGISAQSSRSSNSVVVLSNSRLPESVQLPSESMFLRSNSDGTNYLYVEQHSKNRLVVLDVTHPIHIAQVSVVAFQGAAFDFVRAVGSSSALICFRDNSSSGVVQFRQPKQPLLIAAPDLKRASHIEDIDTFGQQLANNKRRSPTQYPDSGFVT